MRRNPGVSVGGVATKSSFPKSDEWKPELQHARRLEGEWKPELQHARRLEGSADLLRTPHALSGSLGLYVAFMQDA